MGPGFSRPPSIMGRNINMGPSRLRPSGGSNAEGYTPGRGLSVGEIMSRREGRSNAYNADGTPVAPGTVLSMPGWNVRMGPGYYQRNSISSTGVAGGVPTSARIRESILPGSGQYAPHEISGMMRQQGGLSQSSRYGSMGQLPYEQGPMGGYSGDPNAIAQPPQEQPLSQGESMARMAGNIGRTMGVPKSFYGTGIRDMMNRFNFLW